MQPKISVIVPIYNTEKYLSKCVDSLLNQTYENIEIILVDDGSTDSSPKICNHYQDNYANIRVIHKKNGGLSSARNAGLNQANGQLIAFVDSDDSLSPTMYSELYDALKNEPDGCIVCGKYVRVDEGGNISDVKSAHEQSGKTTNEEFLRELLLHVGDASACTKLFPRALIGDIRFDENKLNEDLLFMLELIPKIQSIKYTGKVGYYYLSRNRSISSGYGKAVIDMASNSVKVNSIVQAYYANLSEEAYRFALYQNMAYLLWVPKAKRINANQEYCAALKYEKENFFKNGILNRYLTIKNKLIIVGLMICPDVTIDIFQGRRGAC
ncbi:MAG: glycosyltransferase [Hespellia sp.]|nr:glycosyltransferase [Hespellia sp.]